jgi:hypothetical protein
VDYSSGVSVFCEVDHEEIDVFFHVNQFFNGGGELVYLLLEFLGEFLALLTVLL